VMHISKKEIKANTRDTMRWGSITLAILLFISCTAANCFAATHTWIGITPDWNTASNWSPASVPGAGEAVQIGVTVQTLPNFPIGSFINPPTVSASTSASCGSIEFGTNG